MADEIKIKAKLDTTGFDRSVKELENKIKQMQTQAGGMGQAQQSLGGSGGGLMGKYAKDAFGDFSRESQQKLKDMFQTQQRQAMQESISMKGKQAELAKMSKVEGEMTKQQEQRVKLLERELGLLKQRHEQTIQTAGKIKEMMPEATSGTGSPIQSGQSGVGGGGLGTILKGIGIASIVKGALNAIVAGSEHMITRERKILGDVGAVARIAGKEQRETFSGQGGRGAFWAKERADSLKMAGEEMKGRGLMDTLKMVGGVAAIAAGGLMAATGVGAAPGGGLAMTGAGMLGIGVAAGGAATAFGSERGRSRAFDSRRYQAMMTKEGMQNYESNLASQKALNQEKTSADQSFFGGEVSELYGFQKSMGISDWDMMGGTKTTGSGVYGRKKKPSALQTAINAPLKIVSNRNRGSNTGKGTRFNIPGYIGAADGSGMLRTNTGDGFLDQLTAPDEMVGGGALPTETKESIFANKENFSRKNLMNMASQIAQGGGTSAGAREGMVGAARLERGFGLQNAGSTMGMLSGAGISGMSGEKGVSQTEDAIKQILAEAVQMGVNESDLSTMPADMQRFTAITAELMTKGGGMAQGAMDTFQASMLGFNKKGMEGAKEAAAAFDKKSGAEGGIEGQIGYGSIQRTTKGMKNKSGEDLKLSANQKARINNIRTSDMREGDWQAMANSMDMDVDDLKKVVKEKEISKQTRFKSTEDAVSKGASLMESLGKGKVGDAKRRSISEKIGRGDTFEEGSIEAKISAQIQRVITAQYGEGSNSALSPNARRSMAVGLINKKGGWLEGKGDLLDPNKNTGQNMPTGAAAEANVSIGDAARMKNLSKYADELVDGSKKLSIGVVNAAEQFTLFKDAASKVTAGMKGVHETFDQIIQDIERQRVLNFANGGKPPNSSKEK